MTKGENKIPLPFPKGRGLSEGFQDLLSYQLDKFAFQKSLQLFDVEIEGVDQARSQLMSIWIDIPVRTHARFGGTNEPSIPRNSKTRRSVFS